MNPYLKALLFGIALVAVLALTLGNTTAPVEACSSPFFDCLDDCDDAVNACYANCGPNDFRCELACNNAWWSCNDACGAAHPGFP